MVGHINARNQPVFSIIACHDIMRRTWCVLVMIVVMVVVVVAAGAGLGLGLGASGMGGMMGTEGVVERGDPSGVERMITRTTSTPPPPAADDRERKEKSPLPEELQVGDEEKKGRKDE